MNNLLIIGCGFTGLCIAKYWTNQIQGQVWGTTRNRADELHKANITPIDLNNLETMNQAIREASAIVISTPPPDPALNFAPAISACSAWLGYLSTTAVYGHRDGAWVDETTPPHPTSKRGEMRLAAEHAWQSAAPRVNIFRLAGIYGAGRGPFEKIRSGRAQKIIKPNQVFGRIHVEDIARIVLASYQAKDQGQIYSLTDDLPAPPEDVLDYAAHKLGHPPLPPISFEEAQMSDMARSFYQENKRVKNDKIRAQFGPLLYPDYQTGLDAIYAQEEKKRKSD